jgi:hypothetical protein
MREKKILFVSLLLAKVKKMKLNKRGNKVREKKRKGFWEFSISKINSNRISLSTRQQIYKKKR